MGSVSFSVADLVRRGIAEAKLGFPDLAQAQMHDIGMREFDH